MAKWSTSNLHSEEIDFGVKKLIRTTKTNENLITRRNQSLMIDELKGKVVTKIKMVNIAKEDLVYDSNPHIYINNYLLKH